MKIREGMSPKKVEKEYLNIIKRYLRGEASDVDMYMLCYADLSMIPHHEIYDQLWCRKCAFCGCILYH